MLFKPELAQKVLSGEKTQTRRLGKPGFKPWYRYDETIPAVVVTELHRPVWQVGKTYAVCPGRGKHSIGRIRLVKIRREQVGAITETDALAEGFSDRRAFINAFKAINPKADPEDLVWVLDFELVK